MGERSFGARWWRESLGPRMSIARWRRGRPWARSASSGRCRWRGAHHLGRPGGARVRLTDGRDKVEVTVDALQLQRNEGWDVATRAACSPSGSTDLDAAGTQSWREAMPRLAGALAPTSPALQPFYVPTLFQALMGPAASRCAR